MKRGRPKKVNFEFKINKLFKDKKLYALGDAFKKRRGFNSFSEAARFFSLEREDVIKALEKKTFIETKDYGKVSFLLDNRGAPTSRKVILYSAIFETGNRIFPSIKKAAKWISLSCEHGDIIDAILLGREIRHDCEPIKKDGQKIFVDYLLDEQNYKELED